MRNEVSDKPGLFCYCLIIYGKNVFSSEMAFVIRMRRLLSIPTAPMQWLSFTATGLSKSTEKPTICSVVREFFSTMSQREEGRPL